MRIAVHAVGRMKKGPERDLAGRYFDRLAATGAAVGLEFAGVTEIAESRASSAAERRRDEARRLDGKFADAVLIALDEHGLSLTSEKIAEHIAERRDAGTRDLVIAIGGADGHDAAVLKKAHLRLAFGAQTWPHQMVRVMLAEQLYRTATILSGHPYHRG